MTQKPVLRVEVGKGRLCGLLSLGDSKSIYCFSALKQQKTEEITPDQRAFLLECRISPCACVVFRFRSVDRRTHHTGACQLLSSSIGTQRKVSGSCGESGAAAATKEHGHSRQLPTGIKPAQHTPTGRQGDTCTRTGVDRGDLFGVPI
jgi:hypothetical protein